MLTRQRKRELEAKKEKSPAISIRDYDDPTEVNYYLHSTFECIDPIQTAQIGDHLCVVMVAFGVFVFQHESSERKNCVFEFGPDVFKTISKHFKRVKLSKTWIEK